MSRIIAGISRGRRLKVPDSGTRPTSDRAKEGLFSSLQTRFGFDGEHVLDLFAGTGALGLEALSRGAASVTLVDNNPGACRTIRANIDTVRPHTTGEVRLVEAKASTFVATAEPGFYTMVLADPPYDLADEAVAEMVEALLPILAEDAVIVVERHRDSPDTAWPAGCEPTGQKLKKRTFGIARFDMAIWRGAPSAEPTAAPTLPTKED